MGVSTADVASVAYDMRELYRDLDKRSSFSGAEERRFLEVVVLNPSDRVRLEHPFGAPR